MVECRYTFENQNFNSYAELLNFVDKLVEKGTIDLSKTSDIVYSKRGKQKAQLEVINKLKASYTPKLNDNFSVSSIINGEPDGGAKSILNFLDTVACSVFGRQLVTPLVLEDYKKYEIQKILEEQNLTLETAPQNVIDQAKTQVEKTIANWKKIQEDSLALHKLFTDVTILDSDTNFLAKFQKNLPDSLNSTDLLIKLHNKLKHIFIAEKGRYPNSELIKGLNLSSKLKGIDQELIGHIDYLFVGADGRLHMYLFKTTSEDPNKWKGVKEEKYKYQLAFLKQMLQDNGVDVTDMEMTIIPVQLKYNDDYSAVTSIMIPDDLGPTQYSTRKTDNKYAMHKYDRDVSQFFEKKVILKPITDSTINRADAINQQIFPDINIRSNGIGESAKEWILRAPDADPDGSEPLVIKTIGEPGHYYDVIIDGKTYPIKTKGSKKTNKEILQVVSEHINDLDDDKGYSTQRLKDAILESYKKGFLTFEDIKGFRGKSDILQSVLSKYLIPNKDADGKIIDYDWELMDDLLDANILVFKNKKGVIDIITLSAFDLNTSIRFNGNENLLGHFVYDSEYIDLKANYGNIELVRTMTILNEALPTLGNVTLGNIGVLSSIGKSAYIQRNIGEFAKKYYHTITNIVRKQGVNINNNFRTIENDRFASELDSLVETYLSIIENQPDSVKARYERFGFGTLIESLDKDVHTKSEALRYILFQIQDNYGFDNYDYYQKAINQNNTTGNMARLYDLVAKAYFNLTGENIVRTQEQDVFEKWFTTPNTRESQNIQYVVNGLQTTYDIIASEFESIYNEEIRVNFDNFYKSVGYSQGQNMFLGNQVSTFNNLYDKATMTFKNPYDPNNNLTDPERKLLKKVLYQIAQITSKKTFKLDQHDEASIAKYIENHPDYLWVPLERASKATSRSGIDRVKAKFRNAFKRFKNIDERFDEFVQGISQEERELLGNLDSDEFYTFSVQNPFKTSMLMGGRTYGQTLAKRKDMISKYGPEYFETNLENILIDYLVKSIQTEQLQKFITTAKAFLLRMHITGDLGGNKSEVQKEIKYIEDYLKINVFNSSIMSKKERSAISTIMPVKQIATHLLIGGNIVGFIRDSIQGLEANFMQTYTKLNTDLDAKSVTAAYAYVTKHATSNAMAVNLLGKLCLKYRLSNTDVGRIAERAKTGRNGLLNYDNWLYGTMRSPDFINRMVLFVAKCMHDGVWDAYSIDSNNNLKYEWRKDKRFSLLADPNADRNSEEYKKQKSLYLSKIREYYEEHPEIASSNDMDMTIDLPTPYSQRQIRAIRAVGDNIYGAYDKSKKSMSEFHSLGICFGMFTTWMNGIVNNYFMKPQRNGISQLLEEQEIDENGNLLFFDEYGNITTENTGMPVYKFVPPIVMGIFPSIAILSRMCRDKGLQATLTYINATPIMKANMRKLLSDLLMSLFMWLLFTLALDPAYKEHKKNAENNPLLVNWSEELLYKGSKGAWDIFTGPINIIKFIGQDSATPIYSVPAQLMRNTYETITGDKTIGNMFVTNTGIGRSFKDTYNIYIKSLKE